MRSIGADAILAFILLSPEKIQQPHPNPRLLSANTERRLEHGLSIFRASKVLREASSFPSCQSPPTMVDTSTNI